MKFYSTVNMTFTQPLTEDPGAKTVRELFSSLIKFPLIR